MTDKETAELQAATSLKYRCWLAMRNRRMSIEDLSAALGEKREKVQGAVNSLASCGQATVVVPARHGRKGVYLATDVAPAKRASLVRLELAMPKNGEGRIALEEAWPL